MAAGKELTFAKPYRPQAATIERYPRAMVVAHWTVAGLVVVHLFVALLFSLLRHTPTTMAVMDLHRSIGLTIFALTALRLGLRFMRPMPRIRDAIPPWQRLVAKSVHAAFYVVLLTAPIVGWLYTNAVGQEATFFWIAPLPTLIESDMALGAQLLTLHIGLALALVALIGLHACGALYNRWVLKNNVFDKMLFANDDVRVSARVSIWVKLLLAGAASVALAAVVGVTGLSVTGTVATQGLDMYDGVLQSTSYARSAQFSFERFVGRVRTAALSPSSTAADHDAIAGLLDEVRADVDVAVERIGDAAVIAEAGKLGAKIDGLREQIKTWRARGARTLPKDVAASFDEIRADIEYLVQDISALGFGERSDMEEEATYAGDVVILTMAAVLILTALIVGATGVTVSRQVRQASLAARRIAGGDYETALSVNGEADMAKLLRSIDEMRQAIHSRVLSLKAAQKEAVDASKLKSQFLANMSHEIRTPMNGVMGMVQLLLRTPLDEKQKRYAGTVMTSSRALLNIINDILDLSKIEAGSMKLDIEPIDMKTMVDEAIGRVEGVAAQKKLALHHAIAPDRLGSFDGDAQRIIQVLVNLLGNAIKFTDRGEVALDVGAGANGATRFSVRDTGPGIPENQLAIVFERFRQVDGTSTRKHGGTGLGLAITKELVDLMKGHVGLESMVGVGTTFWVELPLDIKKSNAAKADAATAAAAVAVDDSMRGLRVLVAEDNEVNQTLAEEILRMLGMVPTIVATGRLALNALAQETYDLVLMDIHMPEMNGDIAIQHIRTSDKPYAEIPIIVVTASAMKGMEEDYLELGADGYVPKPIDIGDLAAKIKHAMERKRAQAAA